MFNIIFGKLVCRSSLWIFVYLNYADKLSGSEEIDLKKKKNELNIITIDFILCSFW